MTRTLILSLALALSAPAAAGVIADNPPEVSEVKLALPEAGEAVLVELVVFDPEQGWETLEDADTIDEDVEASMVALRPTHAELVVEVEGELRFLQFELVPDTEDPTVLRGVIADNPPEAE